MSTSTPSSFSPSQPNALITGASRGIGAAIATRLAKDGFRVLLNATQAHPRLVELQQHLKSQGFEAELAVFDVSSSEAVNSAVKELIELFGPIHTLVNNAGISKDSLLMRLKDEDLDQLLNVNLKGALYCARAVSQSMMKARAGTIIQISSVVGEMGNAGQVAYSSSKAALIGMTKSIAKELATRGIRCNAVTPGFIQTDMTEALTETQKAAILQGIPLGSLGSPEDVAECVSFLASDRSRYITGQVIGVNGGLYI